PHRRRACLLGRSRPPREGFHRATAGRVLHPQPDHEGHVLRGARLYKAGHRGDQWTGDRCRVCPSRMLRHPDCLHGSLDPDAGGAKFVQMDFSRSRSVLIFFTGRKMDAEGMYRLGIIDEVVAPEELMATARGIAEEIVRKSPLAIAKAKAAFNAVEEMPLRDGYIYEQTVTLELSRSDDAIEARRAFLEGREPRYTGSRGGAQSVCRPDPQNSGLPLES